MSKVTKTIKLSEATFASICEVLQKKYFHAQNPEDSLRKCETEESFDYWKKETLSKYPNASLVVTHGELWFSEVRVSDPFFENDRANYKAGKASYLQSKRY